MKEFSIEMDDICKHTCYDYGNHTMQVLDFGDMQVIILKDKKEKKHEDKR